MATNERGITMARFYTAAERVEAEKEKVFFDLKRDEGTGSIILFATDAKGEPLDLGEVAYLIPGRGMELCCGMEVPGLPVDEDGTVRLI